MLLDNAKNVTDLLKEARLGSDSASAELMNVVYTDLKVIARRYMKSERDGHTLQPTAIVNEAFLRLFRPPGTESDQWRSVPIDWQSRAQFLGIAAKQMRQVLIDHGRTKGTKKRSGLKVSLDDASGTVAAPEQDFEKLDQLLTLLASKDPEAAKVVELKFFGGLTNEEAAEAMGMNIAKVRRSWAFAHSWLRQRMQPLGNPETT